MVHSMWPLTLTHLQQYLDQLEGLVQLNVYSGEREKDRESYRPGVWKVI